MSNLFGGGGSTSIFDMEDEQRAKVLVSIAESVFNSIQIREDSLEAFLTELKLGILLHLDPKKMKKKDIKEVDVILQDLMFVCEEEEAGRGKDWRSLKRGAMGRLITIITVKSPTVRESFLRSLKLPASPTVTEDDDDDESW